MAIEKQNQPIPTFIKTIKWLIIVKISLLIAAIILFAIVIHMTIDERGILSGFRNAIVERYAIDPSNPPYAVGLLIGTLLFPILSGLACLYFLLARNYWGTIILAAFDVLIGLSNGFPILSIVIAIMLATNSKSEYFRKRKENEIENDSDGDGDARDF